MKIKLFALLCVAALSFSCGTKEAPKFAIEETGVGIVKIGTNATELPKSAEGIYDRVERESFFNDHDDCNQVNYLFYNGNDVVISADCSDDDIIDGVIVMSPNFEAPQGVKVGMPVKELFDISTLKHVFTNTGDFYYLYGDEKYVVRVSDYNEKGNAKLEEGYLKGTDVDITIDDYKDDAKVVSISIY